MTAEVAPAAALHCRGISVRYSEVSALTDVSVGFAPKLIHVVVGQNGAGKTTFARVAAGILKPIAGTLAIGEREVPTGNVSQARAAGVQLVHQSFALPPSFTVAEAMEFGADRGRPIFTRRGLQARWKWHLENLGVRARPRDRIRDLPVEAQQAVEIARALVADARVLILDEPTAVLSPTGIETLFERLRSLKAGGVTIILILHKIREVLGAADTVTVLRGGRLVEGPIFASATDARRLSASIIGSQTEATLTAQDEAALVGASAGEVAAAPGAAFDAGTSTSILTLQNVATRGDAEGPALDNVSLRIAAGEIVGVAGVEGNGQRTLVRTISELAEVRSGRISLSGKDVTRTSLISRRASGLRVIPFERNSEGLSLSSALWENWAARQLLLGPMLRLINPARYRKECDASLKQWDVRYASTSQAAGSLSGGNAQKLILAREIDAEALLIVAAQPTRGLDVGATAFVWRSLREARARSCGVLFISSDLDELFDISDRLVVMLSGRITAEFRPPYRLADVGAAMTGPTEMRAKLIAVLRALSFVLLALVLCGVIFEFAGYSALEMFESIADGAFLNPGAWQGSLRWALPLFITACGVIISFRSGYFNVGAQGQFYIGAIAATCIVDFMNGYPAAIVIPLSFVAGVAGGAIWALWPGYLRVRSGADEVITTLMGNFIAGLILIYMTGGILKDPSGTGQVMASRPVAAAYRISSEDGLSSPIVITAILVGVLMWVLVNRTAFGVLSTLAGRNPTMVVWQGARMSRLGFAGFAIGGALAGLSGAIEVLGPNGRLVSGFLPTHGFTAILIALVAGLSISGAAIVSLFFGGLAAASLYLPVLVGLPAAAIDIINAAIALFITARAAPGLGWLTGRFNRAARGA